MVEGNSAANSLQLRYKFKVTMRIFSWPGIYTFSCQRPRGSVAVCLRFLKLLRRRVKITPPLGQEILGRGDTSSMGG